MEKKIWKVFKAYMYDENDNLVLEDDCLTSASLAQTAQKSVIQNGSENGKWGVFYSGKELTGELSSNVLDINKIAVQAGTALRSGAIVMHTDAKVYEVSASKTITLDKTPIGTPKFIDVATGEAITDATVDAVTVTFTGAYSKVKVMPYAYDVETNGEELVISSDGFPSAYRLLLKTVEVSNENKITADIEIEIPKAVPSTDWTIAVNSNFGDGIDNTLSYEAIKDELENLAYIKRVER